MTLWLIPEEVLIQLGKDFSFETVIADPNSNGKVLKTSLLAGLSVPPLRY
jgi:hypothetical protein